MKHWLALAALVCFGSNAQALSIKGSQASIAASTVTITGTGSKCFSVDDPTFVVDCDLERVGIGTASPGTKLHMSSGTLTVDGNQTGDVFVLRSNLSNADLHMLLDTTGAGGSESTRLDLKTSTRHWLIQNAKGLNSGLAFRDESAGSATRMFIDTSGNVGIGTASPCSTCTLHVAGGASVTGFLQISPRTRAQIDLLVPTNVGQYVDCTDCTLPGLCRSTGTLAAQWRKVESATLGCGTGN